MLPDTNVSINNDKQMVSKKPTSIRYTFFFFLAQSTRVRDALRYFEREAEISDELKKRNYTQVRLKRRRAGRNAIHGIYGFTDL